MCSLDSLFARLFPGCNFSGGFQQCSGGPDLPGVHGERPVVGGAACYHVRRGSQELPGQVRDAAVMTSAEPSALQNVWEISLPLLSFFFHHFFLDFILNGMIFRVKVCADIADLLLVCDSRTQETSPRP